jgi:hypothetical protein
MTSLTAAREDRAALSQSRLPAPVMTISEEGLVLGATVLAPLRRDAFGLAEFVFAGAEERILALLAIAYGKIVGPDVLGNIHWAGREWRRGQPRLAQIHLAHSGLPRLADVETASSRLLLGEQLLAAGVAPRDLITAYGHPVPHDLLKAGYNPDQPRAPAGNSDGGQWTSAGAASSGISPVEPHLEFVSYTPVHELPDDAVVVTTPTGQTIADPDSHTKKLMAPPHADFRQVYAAGRVIASLPYSEQYHRAHAAIAQKGTYDFQRNVQQQKFYDAYIHASN